MNARREAPVYTDAMRAARWILENIDPATPIGERIHCHALVLCEQIATSLGRHTPDDLLYDADETLVRLRTLLRLLLDTGTLEEAGFLHLSRELDLVGRQIGGWIKRLAQPGAMG